jgi:protein O-mannosyl-transferase
MPAPPRKLTSKAARRAHEKSLGQKGALTKSAVSLAFDRPSDRRIACIAVGLAVVAFFLYYPVTRNQFVNYDDPTYVLENSHIQSGLSWNSLRWAFRSTDAANWHPLTWLSHALDYQLYGLHPAGHHLSSIALHACNVTLLFLLLYRATGNLAPSVAVAALFAVHPLNVESIAWVAERKTGLSMFFFLLTLAAYGWYARKPNPLRYLAVFAGFAMGLMAKPMVITLPFVLLLVDYWPLARIRGMQPSEFLSLEQASPVRIILEKLPFLFLSVCSGIITIYAQRAGGAIPPGALVPLPARLGNAVRSYAIYEWKAFCPAGLAVFYPGRPLDFWQVAVPLALLILVSIYVWKKRSRRYLTFGWLFYLGTLVPVIGIIQVGGQAMADRYAYMPLIGIFIMVAWSLEGWAAAHHAAHLTWGVTALAVVGLSLITLRQISFWRNSYELWSHALAATEKNLVAEDNMGSTLLDLGRPSEALPYFQRAAAINPRDALSHSNIAADLLDHGHLQEAVGEYELTLTLTSDPKILVVVYQNLGTAYRKLGDLAKSRQNYQLAANLNPQLSSLLARVKEKDTEIESLRESLAQAPSEAGFLRLAQALQRSRRDAEARTAFQKVLEIDPKSSEASQGLKSLETSEQ